MYQFNLNYIWSNWVGPTQLQFIQWIIFLSVGYWSLSSRNDPIFFCSLHWRNLSLYNKITTSHFKQIRFWWKNVIKFRGKVYSNFFKFVQQLFFLSVYLLKCLSLFCFFCLGYVSDGKWSMCGDPSQHSGSVSVCDEHLQDVPKSGIKETQSSRTPNSSHTDFTTDITGLSNHTHVWAITHTCHYDQWLIFTHSD